MKNLLFFMLTLILVIYSSNSEIYYSRQTGPWNSNQTWSNVSYDGPPAASFPTSVADNVFVGNSKVVTLDQSRNIGITTVSSSGRLVFGIHIISGNSFLIDAGGIIEIGSPAGITQSAAAGNVQTTLRDYNAGNHQSSVFIYSGVAATTGDGLPNVAQSIEVNINPGLILAMNNVISLRGDLIITSGTLNAPNVAISLGGNFINNSVFTGDNSTISFNGISDQSIMGTTQTTFFDLHILKSTGTMKLMNNITCTGSMRLISNTILDQNGFNITLGNDSKIFSDYTENQIFKNEKHINQPEGSKIIKQYANVLALPNTMLFPVGINGIYSPCKVTLNNGVTINNATISVKVFGNEHPNVLKTNYSIKKYWDIATTGVLTPGSSGFNLEFGYVTADIKGNPEKYHVFRYNDPKWYMDPGTEKNEINNTLKTITTTKVTDILAGGWTAGELKTGRNTYYSRMSGNYDNFNTWSTESHTSSPATKAPDNDLDMIMVGNGHTVNLTQAMPPAAELIVEGTGTLLLNSYNVPNTVGIFRLLSGGALGMASTEGISVLPSSGAVRSPKEFLDQGGIFIYTGISNQETGAGLPDKIGSLIINKDNSGSNVRLSKSLAIEDSLVINNGVLDQTDMYYEMNGTTPDVSSIIMRGGKLKLWGSFPDGYMPAAFTQGTVEYTENGQNSLIKGIADDIKQYNNLLITGKRGVKQIIFNPADTIKIYGSLNLEDLEFSSAQGERFITDGSTISFNGDSEQLIPLRCKTDSSWMKLNYYNLKIDGKGTKKLSDSNHKVLNDVILISGALDMNGRRLDVYGNWVNYGATLINNSKLPVNFFNTKKDTANYIKSSNLEFYDIVFNGQGGFTIKDDLTANNITIENNTTLLGSDYFVKVKGNWINNGSFEPEKSTVSFEGSADQQIIKTTPEKFYNLKINNNKELLFSDKTGSNIQVMNLLTFNKGVINADGNGRYVSVDSNVVQLGDGRVFGTLRIKVKPGTTQPLLFAVGSKYEYRPAIVKFDGTGGTAGYVETNVQEVNQNFFNGNGGSGLVWDKAIQMKWDIMIPQGGTFGLGNRNFSVQLGWTESDLTAFSNPIKFNMMRLSNGVWYKTNVSERNNYYTKAILLDGFGSFITGEPEASNTMTYYSRDDGFWNNPSTWSTSGYTGSASASIPTKFDNVMIGNGKTVTLNSDVIVDATASITVNGGTNSGTLDCRKFIISGEGSFNLQDNATLIIGSPDGISKSGDSGNVRTGTRNFNETGTAKSNFIYSSDEPQHTGSGLPPEIKELTIKLNEITLDNSLKVNNKILLESGSFVNTGGTSNLTIAGDFLTKSGASFDIGSGGIIFTGTKEQVFDISDSRIKSNHLVIDKESGIVIVETDDLFVYELLELKSGVINTRMNNKYIGIPNDAVIQLDKGYVDGKVSKFFNPNFNEPFTFPIGEGSDYTPVLLDINDMSGQQGFISAISVKGAHPNLAASGLNLSKTINRYWSLSADANFGQNNIFFDMTINYSPADLPSGTDFNKLQVKSYFDNQWHPVTVTSRQLGTISLTGLEKINADYIIGEEENQGIDDIYDIDNLIAYPMPAKDKVYISFTIDKPAFAELKLYDNKGVELCKVLAEELSMGKNVIPVYVGKYSAGSYFYILTVNNRTYNGSIIKVK